MENISKKTINGLIWSGIDSYGVYLLKFVFSITIARILDPRDYGLVGMMAIFIALGTMITDGGFQASILQKKTPELKDYSSVFVLNTIISIFIYLIIFFGAPLIADFYDEPKMILISKVMGLGIVVAALGGIQQTWYIKNMKFKSIAKLNFFISVLSGSIGVTIALLGYGVWALIFQTLLGSVFRTALFWVFSKLRIPFKLSWNALKKLYSFGWKMFLQSFLTTLFNNIYYPLIGRYFNVVSLGYYTSAARFQHLTITQTNGAVSKVLFPTFSSIQDNKEKLARASQKSVRLLVFIMYPIITILIVTAHPFVNFFLTEKWLPAVPYMQLLYLFGFIWPIMSLITSALNSIGESSITLRINIIGKVLLVISIFIGINFNISGLIVANLGATIITYIITAIYFGKHINYKIINQLKDIVPTFLISLVAYFLSDTLDKFISIYDLLMIILQVSIVVIVYYLLMRIFKPKSYIEFKSFVIPYIPQKFKSIV